MQISGLKFFWASRKIIFKAFRWAVYPGSGKAPSLQTLASDLPLSPIKNYTGSRKALSCRNKSMVLWVAKIEGHGIIEANSLGESVSSKHERFTQARVAYRVRNLEGVKERQIHKPKGGVSNSSKLKASRGTDVSEDELGQIKVMGRPLETYIWEEVNNDLTCQPMKIKLLRA